MVGLLNRLIRQSYERIAPATPRVIEDLYRRLFERCPETRALFDPNMNNQYGKFAATIELCVMEDEGSVRLDQVLARLKDRHDVRGVQNSHYPMFVDCMLEAFAAELGDEWTAEHDAAWRRVLTNFADRMKRETAV